MIDTGTRLPAALRKQPLLLSDGSHTRLGDHGWVVLYFYPKDNTPGCTTESRDFNALLPEFDACDATVLGVSRDSARSHAGFRKKQDLAFELISDGDEALCRAFDVIQPKKLYGRDYEGIERSTFLIDPQGRVQQVWRKVKVPGHAQAVLDALRTAQAA